MNQYGKTHQIAQEVSGNPKLRSLFNAARGLLPERLRAHIDFINSLKAQEKGSSNSRIGNSA